MRTICLGGLTALALLVTGCTRYEYDIVQPPDLARHIGKNADATVTIEPITYRMRTVDNRLVVRAYNDSDQPIELLGAKSSVVDPGGQSHPLPIGRGGQTIEPRSFVKLILPPPRPRVYDSGPTFGFGIGMHAHHFHHHHHHRHRPHRMYVDPYPHEPRYFAVYDENDPTYWDWRGVGEARLTLTYRRGEEEFRHAFTFRRQKM